MTEEQKNKFHELLIYEIGGSWWANWIGWEWGQDIVASYYIRKVKRKLRRFGKIKS